ncbi:MAG: hypothetical protein M3Y72_11935, partial [Acidobacteriota bacterium]|nr:hypothetical protein [Acidobacteriota bacterium]
SSPIPSPNGSADRPPASRTKKQPEKTLGFEFSSVAQAHSPAAPGLVPVPGYVSPDSLAHDRQTMV